jgi:hypothetical protein
MMTCATTQRNITEGSGWGALGSKKGGGGFWGRGEKLKKDGRTNPTLMRSLLKMFPLLGLPHGRFLIFTLWDLLIKM